MTSFTTGYRPMFDLDFLDTYKNDDDDDNLVLYCTENDDGKCHFVLGKREEKDDDHVNVSEISGHDKDEGDYDYDHKDGLQEVEGDEKEVEEQQQHQLEQEEDVEEEEEEEEYNFHIALGDEPTPGNDEEILLNFTNINGSEVHMRFLLHVPPGDMEAFYASDEAGIDRLMDRIYREAQNEIDAHNRRVANNNNDAHDDDETNDEDDSDDGDDDRNGENVNGRAFPGHRRRPVRYEDRRRMKRVFGLVRKKGAKQMRRRRRKRGGRKRKKKN